MLAAAVLGLPVQGHSGGLPHTADRFHREEYCAAHAAIATRGMLSQEGSGERPCILHVTTALNPELHISHTEKCIGSASDAVGPCRRSVTD